MAGFNPYYVDEIVSQTEIRASYFGLISNTETAQTELHGYEVTMSGRLVLPELKQQSDNEEQEAA
jgi:hypothetical protein